MLYELCLGSLREDIGIWGDFCWNGSLLGDLVGIIVRE